jgi:hypothetical protein
MEIISPVTKTPNISMKMRGWYQRLETRPSKKHSACAGGILRKIHRVALQLARILRPLAFSGHSLDVQGYQPLFTKTWGSYPPHVWRGDRLSWVKMVEWPPKMWCERPWKWSKSAVHSRFLLFYVRVYIYIPYIYIYHIYIYHIYHIPMYVYIYILISH